MPTATRARAANRTTRRPASRAKSPAGISDAAILKATGRTRSAWFKILDTFNVKVHGHKAAAAHVHDTHECSPWWSQMIVVTYEQARGLRIRHQTTSGFSVSASRVIAAPISDAYAAVTSPGRRAAWLEGVTLRARTSTPGKYARFAFVSGARLTGEPTPLDINFYAKGPARCQVAIQHSRLPDARTAARMKTFWGRAADRLKESLES